MTHSAGLHTAGRGLTRAEAAARLVADGPNDLPAPPRVRWWRRLAAEMFHFFALLFWVAGALAFVAGLPQLGIAVFAGFLYVTPIAELLDQAPPSLPGFLVALLAIPAVLAADAIHKSWRRRER
ncbi:MAG TPA: cation-transporting P-type ATPase [Acidimicrobiales bacterium]|nr:cation-transporting P-type ATPase [Acidimicrobiales bacterium]